MQRLDKLIKTFRKRFKGGFKKYSKAISQEGYVEMPSFDYHEGKYENEFKKENQKY
jgi:hypothetical protein